MRIFEPKVIITKLKQNQIRIVFLCILAVGLFLRTYNIQSIAEFLGDQGRTSIILYEWLHGGALPLVGPTTLSNQHLGPLFYYLLAPFYILGGFEPLSGSLAMVFYGVCAIILVYASVQHLYGNRTAQIVSLLYAITPVVVTQDRIIWEPNLVVLFALGFALFVILLHRKQNNWSLVGLGATCGALVQLHYPNLIFIGLLGFLLLARGVRKGRLNGFIHDVFFTGVGFLAVLAPFIFYEARHNFVDIHGIFSVIGTGSQGLGKRVMLHNFIDYAGRVFGTILPGITPTASVVLLLGWGLLVLRKVTFLHIFWSLWFFLGLGLMARYNGVVHDHYLLFLLVPFLFILSSFIRSISQARGWRIVAGGLLLCVVIVQLWRSDIWYVGRHDLVRTKRITTSILTHANKAPFSFTLIHSPSFSDLHYRYFFLRSGIRSQKVDGGSYDRLYVVCDRVHCPNEPELKDRKIEALCFDHHCSGKYPIIDLGQDFMFIQTLQIPIGDIGHSMVYVFSKKSVQ